MGAFLLTKIDVIIIYVTGEYMTTSDHIHLTRLTQEDRIIRCMFFDRLIQARSQNALDPVLFDDPDVRNIVAGINQYQDKYKMFPTPADLEMLLPVNSSIQHKFHQIVSDEIDDNVNPDSQVDMIERFFKSQRTKRILENYAADIHNGTISDKLTTIIDELTQAVNFSIDSTAALSMRKDLADILEKLNRTDTAIPSSLNQVRMYTGADERNPGGGGWYKKAVSGFMGMPNIGKTIFLCNEAAYAYRAGYNVLYITLEMHEELIYNRILANIAQIEQKEIKDQDSDMLLNILEKHVLHNGRNHGDVYCKQLTSDATSVDIRNTILEAERVHGVKIDFLVLDYLGLAKPIKIKSSGNTYTMGKEVAEEIRNVAMELDIAILTATQLNRSGYDDINAGMANTSDSSGVNMTLDLLITITQDEHLRRSRLFANTIVKNRFGEKDVMLFTYCDYLRMTLTDASEDKMREYAEKIASTDQNIEFPTVDSNSFITKTKSEAIEGEKSSKQTKNVDNSKPLPIIPISLQHKNGTEAVEKHNISNSDGTTPEIVSLDNVW